LSLRSSLPISDKTGGSETAATLIIRHPPCLDKGGGHHDVSLAGLSHASQAHFFKGRRASSLARANQPYRAFRRGDGWRFIFSALSGDGVVAPKLRNNAIHKNSAPAIEMPSSVLSSALSAVSAG
jgi:hypothetical protein